MHKPPQSAEELFAALKTATGLGADATAGEVLQAIEAQMTKAEPPAEGDEVKTLAATVTSLAETVKTLSTTMETNERQSILLQAAREGKVVPKSAEALPIAQLKALCAELPVTVPLDKRTPDLVHLSSSGGVNPELDEVSKRTGVTDEDRKKYLKR